MSAWEDIFDLVLSRWDKHQEWSPWNCILLTKDEAAAHDRLVDLEEVRGALVVVLGWVMHYNITCGALFMQIGFIPSTEIYHVKFQTTCRKSVWL